MRVRQALKVMLVPLVATALLVSPEAWVQPDPLDQLDLLGIRAWQVQPEALDPLDPPALPEQLEPESREPLAQQGRRE